MSKIKTSWEQKFERACSPDLPKVVKIEGKMTTRWGTGTVVIPNPRDVDRLMKKVPRGKLITINEMRLFFAARNKATIGCPITTGIFAWLAANRAQELANQGKKGTVPYWRTLKTGGEINPKYPGGLERQKELLEAEGHRVIQKGKRWRVADYEKKLFRLKPPHGAGGC